MVTIILGAIGLSHLFFPRQLLELKFSIMELRGWYANKKRFIHSETYYRIVGVLFILFASLHYLGVIDFSFLFQN